MARGIRTVTVGRGSTDTHPSTGADKSPAGDRHLPKKQPMTRPMGGTAIQAPHRVAPYDRVKGRDGARTTSCSGAWSLTRSFGAILHSCIERCSYPHQYTSSQYMPLYRHKFIETSLDMLPITVCRWNCCCDIIVKDAPTRARLAPSNWLGPAWHPQTGLNLAQEASRPPLP